MNFHTFYILFLFLLFFIFFFNSRSTLLFLLLRFTFGLLYLSGGFKRTQLRPSSLDRKSRINIWFPRFIELKVRNKSTFLLLTFILVLLSCSLRFMTLITVISTAKTSSATALVVVSCLVVLIIRIMLKGLRGILIILLLII